MLAGQRGRSLVTRMPRERVLTESDGPFAQVDGKSIMPWSVEGAVRDLGRLWNLSEESAEQVVRYNFRKLCAE
jgi:TatD DNase family protein